MTVFVFPQDFQKNRQLVPSYAFPFYIIGTSFMFAGMFYSAFIIERSSEEYHFEPNLPSKIYWLQPGNQNVGDQVFNSFLAVKDGPGFSMKRKMQYIKSKRVRKYDGRHTEIYSTVLLTIFGFIIQFIGLRGLHASVILAQLGSTFVMSIIRTCLRTERMAPGENKMREERDLVSHKKQELDCFAFHLERIKSFSLINSSLPESPSDESLFDSLAMSGKSIVEQLIYTRTRLADLTSTSQNGGTLAWDHLPIRIIAQRLAETINSTMDLLSSWDAEFKQRFQFELTFECTTAPPEPAQVFQGPYAVEIVRSGDVLKWKVNAQELEAIIGLWTWSLYKSDSSWISPPGCPSLSRVVGLSESEAGDEKTYRYFLKWIYRQTEPKMISAKSVDIPHRLFGLDTGENLNEKDILTVDTQNELEVMIAQDIYIRFLRQAVENLKSMDFTVDVIPGPQNSYVAQNGPIAELVHCFEDLGLGSREDALLCIIPVLKDRRLLPPLTADCPNIRKRTEDYIKKNDWRRAFQLVEWLSQRSDGGEMEFAIHELGDLCRKALLTPNSTAQEIGLQYLCRILGQDMRSEFLRVQGIKYPSTWSAAADYQLRWQGLQRELAWVARHISNRLPGMDAVKRRLESINNPIISEDLDAPAGTLYEPSCPDVGYNVLQEWLTSSELDFERDPDGTEDSDGYHWALQRNCYALLYFVLVRWAELGVEISDPIQHAYVVAAQNRSTWGIRVLQRRRLDIDTPNSRKVSALMELIVSGDLEAVRTLLKMGAKPDGDDTIPNARPLIIAAQYGLTKMVELLLAYGATIDAVDGLGMSALYWACSEDHVDLVRLLGSHGASLAIRSAEKGPFHSAVFSNNFQMVQVLLELGADINVPDNDSKKTALTHAVQLRRVDMLRLLLANGADIHTKDDYGMTALDWAMRDGFRDGAAILEASIGHPTGPHRSIRASL